MAAGVPYPGHGVRRGRLLRQPRQGRHLQHPPARFRLFRRRERPPVLHQRGHHPPHGRTAGRLVRPAQRAPGPARLSRACGAAPRRRRPYGAHRVQSAALRGLVLHGYQPLRLGLPHLRLLSGRPAPRLGQHPARPRGQALHPHRAQQARRLPAGATLRLRRPLRPLPQGPAPAPRLLRPLFPLRLPVHRDPGP